MTGKFLFGFLVGAAVGLLLAPEKGESMLQKEKTFTKKKRKNLKRKSNSF